MFRRLRKIIRKSRAEPAEELSEMDRIFESILTVSSRIHRAERLKQFGEEEGIDVGVSGSDAFISLQNERHDALLRRYRELREKEEVE